MRDTIILDKIAMLPESMKDELDKILDSLLEKSGEKKEIVKKPRKAGFLKGTFIMSDDFDEPLEDFKEYM
ncbi:MAG: DUF2281 domain-containing protein [Chitinophagales bacterium]